MDFFGNKRRSLESELSYIKERFKKLLKEHSDLTDRWNDVVADINAKGGRDFLDNGRLYHNDEPQFTQSEIESLIRLCHPDKHNGRELATRMTARLLELRQK